MQISRKLTDEILISELGFGAWAIGGGAYGTVSNNDAIKAMTTYVNAGGNFIDTAENYSDSELIIGQFIKDSSIKNEIIIASKTQNGSTFDNVSNIESSLDKTLKRLGRDYVDLYYFHLPPEDDDLIAQGFDIMENMKQKGKIRAIGASIKGPDVTSATVDLCKKYIDGKKTDAIQLVYSILRQQTDEVFEYAAQNNVALVGRTSLESGFLTGKYKKGHVFAQGDHRNRWNNTYEQIIEHVEQVEDLFIGKVDDSLVSLALRFAMAPSEITNTIVGAKNEKQMTEILEFASKPALDTETINTLKAMFKGKTTMFNAG